MKTRVKKNKKKSRRGTPQRFNGETANLLAYPAPHKMWTVLKCYTVNGLIDALLPIASKVYRPTSLFDIDSDVGGPSYGGYTFFATMYNRYRVLKFDYEIKWCNLQADAVLVAAYPIPTVSTPSELSSSAYPEIAEENSMGKSFLLGPTDATPLHVMRGTVDCYKLWGTPEVATDASFAANAGQSPAANSWLMLTAQRINGTALSTGAQYTLTVTAHGYWDEKLPQVG